MQQIKQFLAKYTQVFASQQQPAVNNKKTNVDRVTELGRAPRPIVFQVALSLAIFSLCFSLLTLGLVLFYLKKPKNQLSQSAPIHSIVPATVPLDSVAGIVQKAGPSTVSIITKVRSTSWFGTSTAESAGTGIIVSADGYILTNKHVVGNATAFKVVRSDGTPHDATLVGTDPSNDIAFLKVTDAQNLPAAELGDSRALVTGQPVVAIGNALGQYQNSVTSGIVSGIGRSITAAEKDGSNPERLNDMIQTDASINLGNSGGPLVDAAGRVIGINTATASAAQGLGFAIPINSVRGLLENLKKTGRVERAYLGTQYIQLTPAIAKEQNIPVKHGAYVVSDKYSAIIADSPAAKAGMKDKDIILAINNVPISATVSLASLLGEYAVGDVVELKVLREKRELSLTVKLEAFPRN